MRKIIWFISGFFKKYKKIVLSSILGTILIVSFILVIWPKLPKPRQNKYVGIVGKYSSAQIPKRVESELGMGLTTLGEDLSAQPGLAKRWEVTEEGKKYRFFLRDDVKWSDGTTVSLADLNFSIPDVTINKIEPDILEFILPEPFSPFPVILTKPVLKEGRFTTGEYEVGDIQADGPFIKLIKLEKKDEILVFQFYDTTSLGITAFKLGEIDELVGAFDSEGLENWPNVLLEREPLTNFYVALFYNNDDPTLRDKSIRQGLSYAIEDKTAGYQRATGPINPKSWAYNPVVKDYNYDLIRAKELIEKVLPPDAPQVELELSSTPDLLPMAEKIKLDWEKVGVTASIKVVASIPSTFQVLLAAEETSVDPDQYLRWHSTQESNFTKFRSPRIDQLLESGRQTLKQTDRRAIYFDFQRFLAEEVPATFLYHPESIVIKRK